MIQLRAHGLGKEDEHSFGYGSPTVAFPAYTHRVIRHTLPLPDGGAGVTDANKTPCR